MSKAVDELRRFYSIFDDVLLHFDGIVKVDTVFQTMLHHLRSFYYILEDNLKIILYSVCKAYVCILR